MAQLSGDVAAIYRQRQPSTNFITPSTFRPLVGVGRKIMASRMPQDLSKTYPAAAPFAPPADSSITAPSSSLAGQTFAPLLDTLHGIGRPTIEPFAPVAPRFEGQAPVATTRPDNSYYQNLFGAKFAPLNQQFFGQGGVSDQAVGEANRRGFLTAGPSGVAGQLYGQTVSDPYARAVSDIQNQVNIIKTETELDLSKYDATRQDDFRKFQADLVLKDRDYGVASVEAQARVDNTYLALESEINQAVSSGATSEKLGELNARINTFQSLIAAETAKGQLNNQAAQEAARLEEERLKRQSDWWLSASGIPGAFSGGDPTKGTGYEAPYAAIDQPRPVSTSNSSPSTPGAPKEKGTYDLQRSIGTDGKVYVWSSQQNRWNG